MNLIETVYNEMTTDTENLDKQSDRIVEHYETADEAGKKLLDDAFVCLCGWSIPSLRKMMDTDGDDSHDNDDLRFGQNS